MRIFIIAIFAIIGYQSKAQLHDSLKLKKIEPSLNILPTDISPYLLQKAKEQKIIDDYKIENAEKAARISAMTKSGEEHPRGSRATVAIAAVRGGSSR